MKDYTTCTADRTQYNNKTEPIPEGYAPNECDAMQAKGEVFEYMLQPHTPGEIVFATHGKQMAIGAGHV